MRCGLVLTVCTDGGYNVVVQRTGDPEVYSTVVTVFDSLPRRCSTHYAERDAVQLELQENEAVAGAPLRKRDRFGCTARWA